MCKKTVMHFGMKSNSCVKSIDGTTYVIWYETDEGFAANVFADQYCKSIVDWLGPYDAPPSECTSIGDGLYISAREVEAVGIGASYDVNGVKLYTFPDKQSCGAFSNPVEFMFVGLNSCASIAAEDGKDVTVVSVDDHHLSFRVYSSTDGSCTGDFLETRTYFHENMCEGGGGDSFLNFSAGYLGWKSVRTSMRI